jgi:hypothetical protein
MSILESQPFLEQNSLLFGKWPILKVNNFPTSKPFWLQTAHFPKVLKEMSL